MAAVDLRAAPSLTRASDDGLARLAAQSSPRRFDRGEFLFRADEPVSRIFLIVTGRVAATVTSRRMQFAPTVTPSPSATLPSKTQFTSM